ncbi:MAG: energy-coupled thiamine transporter ThiT [Bacilli bacterium]|nr:energy-coupled thiamine transporter ThiT [Bacilli bacterium]
MEEKKPSWFANNLWIIPFGVGLLAFLGLALPLVEAHPITYDPAAWKFTELPRQAFGAGMLFGLDGAVAWLYFILYGLVLIALVLSLVGGLRKKGETLSSVAMFLFLIAGVLFFLSGSNYGFCNATATVGQYKEYFVDPSNPAAYSANYYWYLKEYVNLADGRLGVGAILSGALSAIAAFSAFSISLSSKRLDIRAITEIAMLCAIAIVLDVVFHFLPNLPMQVGSLSIALVPIYIIALRHGPARGLLAASFIYGLITCFTDGYGLWLYPLDYLVAYSGVAIIGFFAPFIIGKDQKTYNVKGILFIILGCVLSGIVRFLGSMASSMVNYGYALGPAVLVNLYCLVSPVLCAIVLVAFYGPLLRLNRRFPATRTSYADEK